MNNGSMQIQSNIIGRFKNLNMDLNIAKEKEEVFRVRRLSTYDLIKKTFSKVINKKQQRQIFVELYNRFFTPIINFILVLVCTTILLRSSLLRRKISFAPFIAILSMSIVMSVFMSVANLVSSWLDFFIVLI